MQKIPVTQEPELQPEQAPTYVVEALEHLLLGGIWWFVLILMPLLQQPQWLSLGGDVPALLFKVQGLVTAAVAIVLGLLRFVRGGADLAPYWKRELVLLVGLAGLGVTLVWLTLAPLPVQGNRIYVAAFQGIVALGYFLSRRGSAAE